MKKTMLLMIVWAMLLQGMVSLKADSNFEYVLSFDSHTKDTYIVKKEIQDIYNELVYGIQKESHTALVLQNKAYFAYKEDIKVAWRKGKLHIKEGDGKGGKVYGEFREESMCMAEVKPRSLFLELFD